MYLLLTHNHGMEPCLATVEHNEVRRLNELDRRRHISFLPITEERSSLGLEDLRRLMATEIRAEVEKWRAKRQQEAA